MNISDLNGSWFECILWKEFFAPLFILVGCIYICHFALISVEVDREADHRDEDVLLYDGHWGEVVRFLVPKLAGTHANSLALILADHSLDQVFVARIFMQFTDGNAATFCELLGKRLRFILGWHAYRQTVLNHFLNSFFGFLKWYINQRGLEQLFVEDGWIKSNLHLDGICPWKRVEFGRFYSTVVLS